MAVNRVRNQEVSAILYRNHELDNPGNPVPICGCPSPIPGPGRRIAPAEHYSTNKANNELAQPQNWNEPCRLIENMGANVVICLNVALVGPPLCGQVQEEQGAWRPMRYAFLGYHGRSWQKSATRARNGSMKRRWRRRRPSTRRT